MLDVPASDIPSPPSVPPEDQALLALPLVPKHVSETCEDEQASVEAAASEVEAKQRPFGNLRDLLRGH